MSDIPVLSADDPVANRKVWADWLRRSDWNSAPDRDGDARDCHTPWDVGIFLADEHWPSVEAVTASDEYEYEEDVEEAIMSLCFGLRSEPRDLDPADLPERVRNRVLMAARAAGSAHDSDSIMWNLDKNSIAELVDEDEWSLVIISSCLISMWEHDQSPMSGAIMSPPDVARLVADILDAAPPSLLASQSG